MGTGLIVAFVVAVWAAYFVPLVLRRYDEASKTESLETLSPLSRVITRPVREPESEPESVEPEPEPIESVDVDAADETPTSEQPAEPVVPGRSTGRAARIAARRRRRTLLTLLALTAVVGVLAVLGITPVWSVAAPVALVVAWLVACRVQVRGERGLSSGAARLVLGSIRSARSSWREARSERLEESARTVGLDDEETIIVSGQMEDVDPGRRHVMEPAALESDALDEQLVIAVPSVATTGEPVWDPLPVTLPTYVTKPRAGRTVRTVDFAQPGAWTSGHVEGEDVELPGHERPAEEAVEPAPQRAANE